MEAQMMGGRMLVDDMRFWWWRLRETARYFGELGGFRGYRGMRGMGFYFWHALVRAGAPYEAVNRLVWQMAMMRKGFTKAQREVEQTAALKAVGELPTVGGMQ